MRAECSNRICEPCCSSQFACDGVIQSGHRTECLATKSIDCPARFERADFAKREKEVEKVVYKDWRLNDKMSRQRTDQKLKQTDANKTTKSPLKPRWPRKEVRLCGLRPASDTSNKKQRFENT